MKNIILNNVEIQSMIYDIIKDIIGEDCSFSSKSSLIEDLKFDSIKIVEFVIKIEEQFNISIISFGDLLESFSSVEKTIQYIIKLINSKTINMAYEKYFSVGTAINKGMIERYGNIITDNFSSVTLENELKFDRLCDENFNYNFNEADYLIQYANINNLKVRGHTLIWHESTPEWVFRENGENVSKNKLIERMEKHISTVVDRYKDVIYCWDVVNEAIDDAESGYLRRTKWKELIGSDYIEYAFRFAHGADPNAILFLNDYNACIDHKCEKLYALVLDLLKKNVPIHGIGLQGHYNINFPNVEDIRKGLNRLKTLGLQIQITEMDISLFGYEDRRTDLDNPTEEMIKKQAERYERIFEVYREFSDVITGVTLWGVADDYTWLDEFPVNNRKDWPLLFDENLHKKDAYNRIINF